jgi:tRNA pseudouridine38-40 synthase
MNEYTHNYKLIIAYDGTAYCGWQIQPNGISIQELIQEKLSIISRIKISLIGSGRTDSGVHALGQTAHFYSPYINDCHRFLKSLNALLPNDIRLLQMEEVAKDFHAQYSTIGKIYHYHLHLDDVLDPFTRFYRLHVREKIDLNILKKAALQLIGKHDFTSFANEAHLGCASRNPIRILKRLDIIEQSGGIRIEFEGDGFLYKMVRNIVGTLLEIAAGKYSVEELQEILAAKDRKKAGQSAAPHGLFLVKVLYSL